MRKSTVQRGNIGTPQHDIRVKSYHENVWNELEAISKIYKNGKIKT